MLVLMTAAQCQQTAEEWINRGNAMIPEGFIAVKGSEDAVKAFDKAIDIDPSNKEAWWGLNDALRSLVVATNYNEEYERQSHNVYAVIELNPINLSDPRSALALSDHNNRTAFYSILGAVEPTSVTKYDVVEVLNGTPYFDVFGRHVFENHAGSIEINLNMTSNTSDSERASRLVFKTLFKDPQVNYASITCDEMYWDRIGQIGILLHHYKMTRANADKVGDWVNLDLRRYDLMYHEVGTK
jgi:tetratricopeptide (TPR) repeat protein